MLLQLVPRTLTCACVHVWCPSEVGYGLDGLFFELHLMACLLMGFDAVQAENTALQGLVVDLAANKSEARAKLAQLKDKYEHLLRGVRRHSASWLRELQVSREKPITCWLCFLCFG